MKNSLLIISTLLFTGYTTAQNVTIPDVNFKAYLVGNTSINTNSDTEIQVSEAQAFNGTLQCNGLSISDMTGIEAFTSLTALHCCCNQITSLDVSMLPNLSAVWCSVNQLTSLNVANGNNTNFNMYYFDTNPNLTCVEVDDAAYSTANWTNIDPTASYSEDCSAAICTVTIPDANFKNYLVNNAQINTNADTEIQCSEAAAFTGTISCNSLNIADLTGLEAFVNISGLHACCNQITTVDVSMMPNLTQVWISVNQLTSVNVANGNNTNFSGLIYFDTNPNLFCIQVDDATYSQTNWASSINSHQSFSEDCATFLSVSENDQSPIISLFPNPSSSEINITTGKFGEIVILAITGQEIMKCTVNGTKTLDISNLESGVYFIKDLHSSAIYKFIKE